MFHVKCLENIPRAATPALQAPNSGQGEKGENCAPPLCSWFPQRALRLSSCFPVPSRSRNPCHFALIRDFPSPQRTAEAPHHLFSPPLPPQCPLFNAHTYAAKDMRPRCRDLPKWISTRGAGATAGKMFHVKRFEKRCPALNPIFLFYQRALRLSS